MPKPKPPVELHFEPPGPGSWELESLHFPHPVSRYLEETHPAPFKKGSNDFARYFGLLIDGEEIAFVNGFAYLHENRVPDSEIAARVHRAEQALAQKVWREQLREWDERIKPASIAKHRKLQALNPETMSEPELVAYLRRCRDHHSAMIAQHHRLTASALIPIGDLLAQVSDWTGLPHSEILELTRGSALLSAGGSHELERVRAAFARDNGARDLLDSDDKPALVLKDLRSLPGESGAAVSDYLDTVENRILDGFDITDATALEVPGALIGAIRSAVSSRTESLFDFGGRIGEIRAKIPAEHQAEFAALLGEVRIIYRLRDERGIYSDIWAAGIMRRAALAAGRRVAERGRIASPELILDANLEEMCALLSGSGGPTSEELANRAEYRTTHTSKEAPHFLGRATSPVSELVTFPAAMSRIMRAYSIGMAQQFRASRERNERKILHGLPASKGVYEGRARRVSSTSDFGRITKGDILVTESTSEAFNILVPILGAIVTDNGGLLSHAAIVSREHGIPGVVGTRLATIRINDGARIRVDGDTGEVTVIK